MLTVRYL